ncbi:hypothetical protein PINS_up001425 [Pythium insidiosum]|nr:hypothetical protein PINS_up001425 [Pythium insidiosum]
MLNAGCWKRRDASMRSGRVLTLHSIYGNAPPTGVRRPQRPKKAAGDKRRVDEQRVSSTERRDGHEKNRSTTEQGEQQEDLRIERIEAEENVIETGTREEQPLSPEKRCDEGVPVDVTASPRYAKEDECVGDERCDDQDHYLGAVADTKRLTSRVADPAS